MIKHLLFLNLDVKNVVKKNMRSKKTKELYKNMIGMREMANTLIDKKPESWCKFDLPHL